MPPRPARLAAAIAVVLAAAPAAAGSQSSNSSSNCSNGRCIRVESFETERGGFRDGWTRVERWDERGRFRGDYRGERRPPRGYDGHYHDDPFRYGHAPRRHRRGDDRDD